MRPIPLAASLLALAVLATGCLGANPGKTGKEPTSIAAPAWAPGDEWVWREPDFVLGGGLATNSTSTHDVRWLVNGTRDINGTVAWTIEETIGRGAGFGDLEVFYKAKDTQELVNATTGAREDSYLKFPIPVGGTYNVTADGSQRAKVAANSTRTATPAGNFTTYPIDIVTVTGSEEKRFLRIYYAPDVGNIVRWETHYGGGQFSTRELVSYRFTAGGTA